MDQLPPLGREVRNIIGPTLKAYEPLLQKNADNIRSITKQTHSYGPTERQQLDVYASPKPSIVNGRRPVLMFLYGGGLISGDRTLAGYADGLCHNNIAAFFARNCGYTTVVTDYRLVNAHEASFPSGGEDVSLAVEWILQHADTFGPEPIDLFIMGNSAGGIHLATFLLHPNFQSIRSRVLNGTGTRLRAAVLLSVPFHFKLAHGSRAEILSAYFGDYEANSPLGLLHHIDKRGLDALLQSGLQVFVLNGEFDSFGEILTPRDDFVKEWTDLRDNRDTHLRVDAMKGHNHISPFCSLSTGVEREEAWGHQVEAFCDQSRSTPPY